MNFPLRLLFGVFLIASCTGAAAVQIMTISIPTNDIIFDSFRNKIYLSVPGTAGVGLGNTITTINPQTGLTERSVFIGSEPGKLALADDGSVLYAALNGAAAFRSYDTATHAVGTQIPLGADAFSGLYFVEDIEVMPGTSSTVAISRRNEGFSPGHEGVVIFDGGIQRPTTTPGHTGSNVIEFSADPSVLYGYNNETTDFGFRTMTIDAGGIQVTGSVSNLISGFGSDIEFTDSLIYATTGRVIDPQSGTLMGTYAGTGLVEPVTAAGVAYFLEGFGSERTLKMFDLDTFILLDQFTIGGVEGTASSLIALGDSTLAFRTSATQLFIVSAIPLPAALSLFAPALFGLMLFRRNGAGSRILRT